MLAIGIVGSVLDGSGMFIPDPGVKKAPDPGSGSATLIVGMNYHGAKPNEGAMIVFFSQ
jgi:hypothetical protein